MGYHPSCVVLFATALLLPRAIPGAEPAEPALPTAAEAEAFLARAEARLTELSVRQLRAGWVNNVFLTDDTDALTAQANDDYIAAATELVLESRRFAGLELPPDAARKLSRLPLQLPLPGPIDPARRAELTRLAASLLSRYGKARACPVSGPYRGRCLGQSEMEKAFSVERDPAVLRDLWLRWHENGRALRADYARFVELADEGARVLGFGDPGQLWRSSYDMPEAELRAEVERLWEEVRPLYLQLHAYVRARLSRRYGPALVPPDGLLPAHLLGNVWGQEWENVYDLVAQPGRTGGDDLTAALARRKMSPLNMVRTGERFFVSLGFARLPESFWKRSMTSHPRDREVVCHPQTWYVDSPEDVRLSMCINVNAHDFAIVHHELGHAFNYAAYARQPFLFQATANDGFDEGLGDAIALSITPAYLRRIGLAKAEAGDDLPLLLRRALDDVAMLPWALAVDEWRWGVFSGAIPPEEYEAAWWRIRADREGVAPPAPRGPEDFDPGAKWHIPGNVPYLRYFLAELYKFQFYRALCRAAGHQGPLHRCSFYGSAAAGERLKTMMSMGASRPWPDALRALTGEDRLDASALLEYYAPLREWLEQQNRGHKVGW